MSRSRTGFARWWRTTFESPLSAYNLDGDPSENRAMAKLGWNACKEATRRAVLDQAEHARHTDASGRISKGSPLYGLLDRIDRL